MLITVCKSKIHRATVTDCNLDYEGSISIDADLIRLADLVPYEKVQVLNLNNGERLETYVIEEEAGSGIVALNGAAARKGEKGDLVIIIGYGQIDKSEAEWLKPVVIRVDGNNKPIKP